MQIGMIGLGRMGGNMVRRLLRAGHACVVWDRDPATSRPSRRTGAEGASSLEDFASRLRKPRAAWIMVPAGEATDSTVRALGELMEAGDAVIDGGNSYFKDDVRRSAELARKGIQYLDVGTSGGVWGLERGYCLMIGGPADAVRRLDPVFRALARGAAPSRRRRGGPPPAPPRRRGTSTAAGPARGTSSR